MQWPLLAETGTAPLRRVVPLTAVLGRYNLLDSFKPMGRRLRGPCPLHRGSNNKAFVIDPNESTWRCFSKCGRGGGMLEFVAELEEVSLVQAAQLVAGWFAVRPLPAPTQRRRAMSGSQPAYKVFVVEDRGDSQEGDGFWTRVGSAWNHKDGKGLNVVLSALPINGRLVLREFTEKDAEEEEKRTKSRGARK